MNCAFLVVCLSTVLVQAHANSVHLCSCSEAAAHRNDTFRGCDPKIRLRRLQVGRVTSPGKVHFKYKLQVDRPLPHPHIDFTLTKLMIPLPCMGGYGSCTYSLCGHEHYSIEKKICAGWGCKCPVNAGIYYSGLVTINVPDLRPLGPAAYGPVNVEIKFREGRRIIYCSAFRINVAYPEESMTERARGDADLFTNLTDIWT